MARTVDPAHRAELLERIVDYVFKHGVSGLSLRPLAAGVGSSPRVLLYYFGSKDDLIVEILKAAGARQRTMYAAMRGAAGDNSMEVCRALWRNISAPASEPVFRLFFEVYGMALQDRRRFATFLRGVVAQWLTMLTSLRVAEGESPVRAEAFATMAIATFRGLLMDLHATRDRKRVNRAFETWLALV